MELRVTIDPRLHDAVIFDLDGIVAFDSLVALVRKLHDAGVATAVHSSSHDCDVCCAPPGSASCSLFASTASTTVPARPPLKPRAGWARPQSDRS